MLFMKENLIELVEEGVGVDSDGFHLEKVQCEQIDTRRWESVHEIIFKYKDKLYSSQYRRGLTECQDSELYEYDDDAIECDEVEAYEVPVTKYRKI